MDELQQLRAEVERLRVEGLRQAEGWEEQKQETQRLYASEVRFKNLSTDLKSRVEALETERDTQRERAELAEEAVHILKARVDELIASLESYGDHAKECQKRSFANKLRKKESVCDCGLETILGGGGITTGDAESAASDSRIGNRLGALPSNDSR